MKTTFSRRRSARLALLALAASLPGLAATAWLLLRSEPPGRLAEAEAFDVARITSSHQAGLVEGARQLLAALAHVPSVRDASLGGCSSFLADLIRVCPLYTNMGVVDMSGRVVCSALPVDPDVNLADRTYFRRAVETKAFSVGEYQVGRITGRSSLNFARPILDSSGGIKYVVFAALDLGWVDRLAEDVDISSGSILSVVDGRGRLLAYAPGGDKRSGQRLPDADALVRAFEARREGRFRHVDADRVEKIYAYASLSPSPEVDIFAVVESASPEAPLNRVFKVLASLAALSAACAFAAGYALNRFFPLRG